MRKLTLLLIMLLISGTAMAQDFSFSAQLRERSEFNAKQIQLSGGNMDVYHLLRTRFSANAAVNEDVTVFIEIQDARMYGSESSTLNTGASYFDLRQGFVKVENIGKSVFDAKVGRQVLAYGNERLLGAIDWSNFGQSFDAGVLSAHFRNIRVDLIGAAVSRNNNQPEYTRDNFIGGLWAVWNPRADQNSVQPFILYDNPNTGTSRARRFTAGVYTNWMFKQLDVEFDGAYQFGEFPMVNVPNTEDKVKIAGYMVGVRVGYTLPGKAKFRIGVGFDRLSGNEAPDEGQSEETVEAFSTLYATNHKFYGFMDYFTSFNNSPTNLGLQDIMVQLSAEPMSGARAGLDFHMLSTVVDPADFLPSGQTTTLETTIGMELDLWLSVAIAKAVWTTFGLSVMDFAERDKRPVYQALIKTTKWGWIQVMVNI